MRNGNRVATIICILIFSAIIVGVCNSNKYKKRIRLNHDIVCGEILSVKQNRSGGLIRYEFSYNNKVYKPTASCLSETKREFEMGRRKIFIAVLKGDAFHNVILETEKDFVKYNINYDDTAGIRCDNYL